ncbi:hypothetical protein [Cysteiniphilum sp. QT6929]|uniref:hypothetical protein n=1 Tax=Cysteiniphilum sp. QT6929 TaxID=2975055 RepID=UPI0024B3555E|nr:hypothetical protein [Cysteiniphilum sp. QT6929]WHN66487.1 hypothetical protein NYP54_04470 [Cysteiniphilum sp. QT6929]
MVNQYSNMNFAKTLEARYQRPLKEVLNQFKQNGNSYLEVAEITGFKISTVRKWCVKNNIRLQYEKYSEEDRCFGMLDKLRSDCAINCVNYLYKQWVK